MCADTYGNVNGVTACIHLVSSELGQKFDDEPVMA